ncbi:RagB/SusD family nutrient uptake outer membrane protein [Membranihabitans maritimus]|uniref:RagB/SusD family nutrient uptake outer membrane protein n=1 Tax=Membranihabitans maritimus TaxID=2904244 RepID=UPI001F352E8B|nr:RagB/SusD family nutrient uptake outer membrane protein [Membranihabitans maritimus]
MKTNRLYILFALMGAFVLQSCNDVLDMAPDGKLSIDEVFSDPDQTGAFLNSCYNNMPAKGNRYFFWSRGPVVWSDEAWDTDAEAEPWIMAGRMYNGDASPANHPIVNISAEAGNGDYWNRYWNSIRNCAIFINKIESAAVDSEADRNRWKAEAHALRAYYYSELLKWYGTGLPIVRESYQLEDDFAEVEKPSYYEVVQFIIEDCNAALNTSEFPWRITIGSEAGRVTKAFAEAIKSKMILFAASPLYSDGQDHWEEAYQINKTSLENLRSNGYELYNTVNYPQTYLSDVAFIGPDKNEYSALYNEYFTQQMAYSSDPVDKETIYQSIHGQGNTWNIDGIGAQDGYKTGTCPSQEMIDAYETENGQTILDLSVPYLDDQHLEPNYNEDNTMYDPQNPYENRDPRFYASIYYNGSQRKCFWNFAETPESHENFPGPVGNRTRIISTYIGEPQTGIHETVRKATRTGYFQRKFLHPNSGSDNPVPGANWKLFRLGEIILNFAEAAVEAGHLEEAVAAVNDIRARVGMPSIPSGLSKEELRLRVRHERRVELAFEETRYFDVRRWTSPGGNLSSTDQWITAMEITRNVNGSFEYNRKTVRDGERKCFTNKFLRVPIPLNEVNRMISIKGEDWQNPGW